MIRLQLIVLLLFGVVCVVGVRVYRQLLVIRAAQVELERTCLNTKYLFTQAQAACHTSTIYRFTIYKNGMEAICR